MQTQILSPELYWLTLTTLTTGLMWVPYVLNRLAEKGPLKVTWDPNGDTTTRVAWADRMMRASKFCREPGGLRSPGTRAADSKYQ
jgi:hypothetical protein